MQWVGQRSRVNSIHHSRVEKDERLVPVARHDSLEQRLRLALKEAIRDVDSYRNFIRSSIAPITVGHVRDEASATEK